MNTNEELREVTKMCRDVFTKKTFDYGASWRIMRPESVTDQIYIKANRIRSLQIKGQSLVGEGIIPEFVGIVNYGVMGLIQLKYGYSENVDIKLQNNSIDSYVRVIVRKYWTDENGNKNVSVDPDTIKLTFGKAWSQQDISAEETILYYPTIAVPGQSIDLIDSLMIDSSVASKVIQKVDGNTRTTVYAYDGYNFNIDVTVDGIQTHGAKDAIASQWGVDAASVGINVVADKDLEVNR